MQLTEEQLLAAYKRMRDIREFEDRLHDENNTGDIPVSSIYIAARKLLP